MAVASFLGRGHVYVVAEIGSNHNGSIETARALIRVAAESGCDAAKFQMWTPDLMYPRGTKQHQSAVEHQLPAPWLPELARECESRGVDLLCSVFDEISLVAVDPFVRAHKVASIEATWSAFVDVVLAIGKPVMISDGTMVEDEIDALRERSRGHDVHLLHCLTAYPAPIEEMSLSEMAFLGTGFAGFGLSDHTMDAVIAPVAAVALGARIVEKHITLDRDSPGPDHAYAITPPELAQMVRAIRSTEAAIARRPRPRDSERKYLPYRRGPLGLRGL